MVAKLTSGWTYSTPLLNGCISIVTIALSCCLIIELLGIQGKYARIGLVCMFESFPVVAGTFGYMFLAPYYFFALFFSVAGVWLVTREKWISWVMGTVLLGIVPAFYQAYIGCFLSLMLLWLVSEVHHSQLSWKKYFSYILRFICTSVGGIAIYYIGMRVSLYLSGSVLTQYEGIADVASTGIAAYINGVLNAYRYFFFPDQMMEVYRHEYAFMYPMGFLKFYYVLLLDTLLMTGLIVVRCFYESIRTVLQYAVLIVCLPAAFNFIFIMCPSENTMIHSIMVYAEVFLFCYVAMSGEILIRKAGSLDDPVFGSLSGVVHKAGVVMVCLFGCLYVYFSNVVYLRMQLQYQQVTSDMTTLVACIKMSEGYDNRTPIAFVIVTDYNHIERNFPEYQELSGTNYINPYGLGYMYPFLSRGKLLDSLKNVCGFVPVAYDETEVEEDAYVQEMPCWPNAGSIRPYRTDDGNDIIVVKI